MAAGDVTISEVEAIGRNSKIIAGEVQLDGANPTPVDLSAYVQAVHQATVALKKASTPGDDPTSFSVGYSGATLNVYAYKTNGTDPTLVASTDNTEVVSFIAIGS